MQVQQVIKNLRDDLRVLQEATSEIISALTLLEKVTGLAETTKRKGKRAKRKMSAAARKRIGDAARARWAAKREKEGK